MRSLWQPAARRTGARRARPDVWASEMDALTSAMARFATQSRSRVWPEHPAFGRLTARQWGVLGYRHTDHHLRQFGV